MCNSIPPFFSRFDLTLPKKLIKMSDSKNGSKSNLNESNMPLLSEEASEKGGDTPEKEVIEMTETEKVFFIKTQSNVNLRQILANAR